MLDTDASAVAISGILHQWQGPPGERRLRQIVYGSKKMNATEAKYGASKLEMYAAYYFILKNHSYLCARMFILRIDNQALSWLKTYSTDQALIGRWIMALEKYHFTVEHRPRTQHRNTDGLIERTNDYQWREKQLEKLLPVADKLNFLLQEEFDRLPVAPWFDLHGRVIPNHPQLPTHLRNTKPDHKNAIVVLHDGVSAASQLRKGRGRCALLYLRHQCLHCKHTKTFIQIIPRTGLTSLRRLGKITCCLHMWQTSPHAKRMPSMKQSSKPWPPLQRWLGKLP